MPKLLRVIAAIVIGFVVGSAVNMGLIVLGGKVVAPPAGADVSTMEGLRASIHLFEPRHFLFPFLAHAFGTLVGAAVAAWVSPLGSRFAPYTVGGLFLLGGVANVFMLPGPTWFNALDLLLAYVPAALLGYVLVRRLRYGAREA